MMALDQLDIDSDGGRLIKWQSTILLFVLLLLPTFERKSSNKASVSSVLGQRIVAEMLNL